MSTITQQTFMPSMCIFIKHVPSLQLQGHHTKNEAQGQSDCLESCLLLSAKPSATSKPKAGFCRARCRRYGTFCWTLSNLGGAQITR